MGRIGRSLLLVGQSYRVLVRDKELMVLPLVSGAITLAVAASFFVGFGIRPESIARREPAALVPLFLFYVVSYATGLFFQAAVVAGATERLKGGDPTIGSALGAAARRFGPILAWAVVAATVGMVLRQIQERVGFVGKIVVAIVGAAWSMATFFVVPVLVLEDRPVRESVSRSLAVMRSTWGESVVGTLSLGAAGLFAWATLVAMVGLLAWSGVGIVVTLAVAAVGIVLLMTVFATLQGIFIAALYRFATAGPEGFDVASGFDHELLAGAFAPRGRSGRS